jgi:hypothetical protein
MAVLQFRINSRQIVHYKLLKFAMVRSIFFSSYLISSWDSSYEIITYFGNSEFFLRFRRFVGVSVFFLTSLSAASFDYDSGSRRGLPKTEQYSLLSIFI